MQQRFEAVAFDFDGTLYPDYRLNSRLIPFVLKNARLLLAFGRARKRLRARGIALPDGAFYAEQAALTARFLNAPAREIEARIERRIYRGYEPLFKKIKLFAGVTRTLDALKQAGFKLGLLSDFPPRAKLEYTGIESYWDAVLCSEEEGALKPDALPFVKLAAALRTAPEKILYVGNSFRYDVEGAKKAGMSAALIKRSVLSTGFSSRGAKKADGARADFVFSTYRQLRDYMLN